MRRRSGHDTEQEQPKRDVGLRRASNKEKRQMPQALHQPQAQAGTPPVKTLLQARLGIATPAEFLTQRPTQCQDQEEVCHCHQGVSCRWRQRHRAAQRDVQASRNDRQGCWQAHRKRGLAPPDPPSQTAPEPDAQAGSTAHVCGDSSQQVHDQAKVKKKNALKRVEGLDSFIARASL